MYQIFLSCDPLIFAADNVQPVSEEICAKYTACYWNNYNACCMENSELASYKISESPVFDQRGFTVKINIIIPFSIVIFYTFIFRSTLYKCVPSNVFFRR